MTIDEMKNKLQGILTPKRYSHSLNVMNTAVQLARIYGADEKKAAVAGLLHDCARDIRGGKVFDLCDSYSIHVDSICKVQPELLHGPLGAKLVEDEYGVTDKEVQRAIHYHTTGCEDMNLLEKVVFIADYIEPGRSFNGVDAIRKQAYADMDGAIIQALDSTIRFVLSKGNLVHPDTVIARNHLILEHMPKDLSINMEK